MIYGRRNACQLSRCERHGALRGIGAKLLGVALFQSSVPADFGDVAKVDGACGGAGPSAAGALLVIAVREVVIVEQVCSLIESKRQVLSIQLPDDPVVVLADPARMVQVLTNLLNNAAKYTTQGGSILLRVEARESSVIFSVTDNGMGMTPELLGRAFEMFSQGESISDRSSGGLGVGLALVKSLVELHGGRVCASSAGLGRGSQFLVTLPQGAVRQAASVEWKEAA